MAIRLTRSCRSGSCEGSPARAAANSWQITCATRHWEEAATPKMPVAVNTQRRDTEYDYRVGSPAPQAPGAVDHEHEPHPATACTGQADQDQLLREDLDDGDGGGLVARAGKRDELDEGGIVKKIAIGSIGIQTSLPGPAHRVANARRCCSTRTGRSGWLWLVGLDHRPKEQGLHPRQVEQVVVCCSRHAGGQNDAEGRQGPGAGPSAARTSDPESVSKRPGPR